MISKTTTSYLYLLCLISFFSARCGNQPTAIQAENPSDSTKSAVCSTDSINPNGSSELALLMRKMFDDGMIIKGKIEKGEEIGAYPANYEKIKSATPTEADMKQDNFDAFADDMIAALKKLHQNPASERKENFNRFVSSCLNCHDMMCPGPKRKIVKLIIE
jgi:hypothetical protein